MIGEVLDHLVSWFAPAAAASRCRARRIYRRGYEGAKLDRLNENWRTPNRSADAELMSDANTIRSRARDLVRNNAYARGIVNALVRNVVGCGIVPQSRIRDDSDEPIESLNDQCEELFDRWAQVADVSGRLTFWEIQRLAFREVIEAGECLIHFVEVSDDRSRPISLALEMIEADRFAEDYMTMRRASVASGNELRRGVEVDKFGRPVAYWLYPGHPQDLIGAYVEPVRRPASEFLHLFKTERIGQTRGISQFAPIIGWLKNMGYYVDNEMQASAVASCFTAAITTMAGPADGGLLASDESSTTDSDSNSFEYLQPGMVARLMPGEKIEAVNPGRPNSDASPWITLMLRSMAVGTGLSYERMAKDYSQTNYSSARASDLEDRREFRADQEWLEYHLIAPVWKRFIQTAVLEGKLPIQPTQLVANYDRFTSHVYQAPGWEWVDPVKEQTASQASINANLSTLADECGQKGKDWVEVLRQRKRERDKQIELGLIEEPSTEMDQPQQDEGSDVQEETANTG